MTKNNEEEQEQANKDISFICLKQKHKDIEKEISDFIKNDN
jgi:hypothetical protein